MIVSPETTVGELASQFPQTIRVFQRLGVEYCCDGLRQIADVCRERQMPLGELAAALAKAAAAPPPAPTDWNRRPLSELAAHLVEGFHEPLREELPRLHRMAVRVQRHRDPYKHVLAVVLYELERFKKDLDSHMATVERELFPLIRRIEARRVSAGERTRFHQLRSELAAENVEVGHALRILRNVTDGFALPPVACATLRGLYHGLKELGPLMQLHVHLENNVLIPRADALLSEARVVRS